MSSKCNQKLACAELTVYSLQLIFEYQRISIWSKQASTQDCRHSEFHWDWMKKNVKGHKPISFQVQSQSHLIQKLGKILNIWHVRI